MFQAPTSFGRGQDPPRDRDPRDHADEPGNDKPPPRERADDRHDDHRDDRRVRFEEDGRGPRGRQDEMDVDDAPARGPRKPERDSRNDRGDRDDRDDRDDRRTYRGEREYRDDRHDRDDREDRRGPVRHERRDDRGYDRRDDRSERGYDREYDRGRDDRRGPSRYDDEPRGGRYGRDNRGPSRYDRDDRDEYEEQGGRRGYRDTRDPRQERDRSGGRVAEMFGAGPESMYTYADVLFKKFLLEFAQQKDWARLPPRQKFDETVNLLVHKGHTKPLVASPDRTTAEMKQRAQTILDLAGFPSSELTVAQTPQGERVYEPAFRLHSALRYLAWAYSVHLLHGGEGDFKEQGGTIVPRKKLNYKTFRFPDGAILPTFDAFIN